MALNGIAGFLSAFAPSTSLLILIRIFAGIGIGGAAPIVFAMGADSFPSSRRGAWLSYIAMFWMVGSVYAALTAWLCFADPTSLSKDYTWRVYAVICSFPALFTFMLSFAIYESPKYLIQRGRLDEAGSVLTAITGEEVRLTLSISSSIPEEKSWELLLKTPFVTKFALLMAIWFSLCFGSYGNF